MKCSIVGCSIWLLLIGVYYVTVGGVVALALLVLSLAVITYSAVTVRRIAKTVQVTITNTSPAIKGEPTAYEMAISGGHRLAAVTAKVLLTITHTATDTKQQHIVSVALSDRHVTIPWQHEYCGHYEVAVQHVACTDMLQLFTKVAPMQSAVASVVLPLATQPFSHVAQTFQQQGEQAYTSTAIHDNGEERAQLKVYSPGDQVKKIHWKLSSKLDELYVQQYAYLQQPELIVAINGADVQHNVALYDDMLEKLAAVLKAEPVKLVSTEERLVTNEQQRLEALRFVLQQPLQQLSYSAAQLELLQQRYPNVFIITAAQSSFNAMEQFVRGETA